MEKTDFEKSVDTVMELYKKMGVLDGLSDEEIKKFREWVKSRSRRIKEAVKQKQNQNK